MSRSLVAPLRKPLVGRLADFAPRAEQGGGGVGAGDSVPTFSNVKLLVGFEGADGSTTFTDESSSGHTLTAAGNSQIDTAQFKFGAASGLFDGSGDWINVPDHADWAFGYSAFTIDAWIRLNATGSFSIISQYRGTGTQRAWNFYVTATQLRFLMGTGALQVGASGPFSTGIDLPANVSWSTGQWYHVRVDRTAADPTTGGSVLRLYVDGAFLAKEATAGSGSGSNISVMNSTSVVRIGANNNNAGEQNFNGWIDELRIVVGQALCASDDGFEPPTAAYARS